MNLASDAALCEHGFHSFKQNGATTFITAFSGELNELNHGKQGSHSRGLGGFEESSTWHSAVNLQDRQDNRTMLGLKQVQVKRALGVDSLSSAAINTKTLGVERRTLGSWLSASILSALLAKHFRR